MNEFTTTADLGLDGLERPIGQRIIRELAEHEYGRELAEHELGSELEVHSG